MPESLASSVPLDVPTTWHNSDFYRRWFFDGVRYEDFDDILKTFDGQEWVDLGCGLNPVAKTSLAGRLRLLPRGPSLVGVDPRVPFDNLSSFDALGQMMVRGLLEEGAAREGDWLCARGDNMPFDGGSKDLLLSAMCFPHHVNDLATAKEVHRILKPGSQARLTAKVLSAEVDRALSTDGAQAVEGVVAKNFPKEARNFVLDNFLVNLVKPKGVRDPLGTVILTKK